MVYKLFYKKSKRFLFTFRAFYKIIIAATKFTTQNRVSFKMTVSFGCSLFIYNLSKLYISYNNKRT